MSRYRESKKALHEPMNNGQIDRILKKRARGLKRGKPKSREGHRGSFHHRMRRHEGISHAVWKAQMCSKDRVITVERGTSMKVPTMTFSIANFHGLHLI